MHPARNATTGWGILSTGHMASVFAADLALLGDEATLVAVGSRDLVKAEAFARDHGFARGYGSYAEVAADPEVDAVYVGSTHNDHHASTRLCLEAGKAVLVEKPMAINTREAEEMVALARERGVFLMEAMWMRTSPLIRKVAEIVASGELGAIRHVSATFGFAFDGPDNHRLLDPDQAGGVIWDAGVYPIHGVNLILGEPDQVIGYGSHSSTGVDNHAAALLTYPATPERPAATATVVCTLESRLPTRLEVYGTQGRIMVDDFFLRPKEISVFRGNDPEMVPEVLTTTWPGQGYTYEAQEVMRCLRAGELASAMVPWADSLAVARTLAAWRASIGTPESKEPRWPLSV